MFPRCNHRRWQPAFFTFLSLIVASLAVVTSAQGQGSARAAALTTEPYTISPRGVAPVEAELGTLRVPLRHALPQGPSLQLRFVRLRAIQPTGAPPVVYLAGGPGGSGIDAGLGTRWEVFDAVRQHADVILLDQRGTGRSEPPPPCPAPVQPVWPLDSAFTAEQAMAAVRREATRCASIWRSAGIDLDAFSTRESAMDIEHLRQAIGAERISLWGMSYGTHLALATIRAYPRRIARVVLMGTEGPDHTLKRPLDADRQLDRLHEWAAQDSVARQFTGDLRGALDRQLARLEHAPLSVALPGLASPLVIGAFDLQLVVAGMLSRAQFNALLPVMLGALEAGDARLLAQFALSIRQQIVRMQAMPLAMDAASGATAARRAVVAQEERRSVLGRALNFPWPDVGDAIGVTDLGDAFRSPVRSRVPTLFISGTLDGRTPASNAEEVRRGFSRSVHLVLDDAGHDDDLWSGAREVKEQVARFLSGGRVAGGHVKTDLLRISIPQGGTP